MSEVCEVLSSRRAMYASGEALSTDITSEQDDMRHLQLRSEASMFSLREEYTTCKAGKDIIQHTSLDVRVKRFHLSCSATVMCMVGLRHQD